MASTSAKDLLNEEELAAWRAFLRAHSTMLRRISRDLDEAGLPPLAWYDVLARAARRARAAAAPGGARRAGAALQQRAQPAARPDREEGPRPSARAATRTGAASTSSSPTRAPTMLEEMWPVYARGIADDFLPALGSNPCEIRQTLESIGRSATRRRGVWRGRGLSASSPAGRAEVDELLRVAVRRPVADEHELRLELAQALGRAAVLRRVRGEEVPGHAAGRGWP